MPLHQMHDNPQTVPDMQRTFTLSPRGHKDIDVVFKNSLYATPALFHIVYNIGQEIAHGRHEIILRAFGHTVAPRYWRFVVVSTPKGELHFRTATGAPLVRATGAKRSDLA